MNKIRNSRRVLPNQRARRALRAAAFAQKTQTKQKLVRKNHPDIPVPEHTGGETMEVPKGYRLEAYL